VVPRRTQPRDISAALNSAFRHFNRVIWNSVCHPDRGFEINSERAQVAAVHANQISTRIYRP
jgi:hypothetical protein